MTTLCPQVPSLPPRLTGLSDASLNVAWSCIQFYAFFSMVFLVWYVGLTSMSRVIWTIQHRRRRCV